MELNHEAKGMTQQDQAEAVETGEEESFN